ncbi:MAG: hypothetical protein ACOCUV_02740 [bacterium]
MKSLLSDKIHNKPSGEKKIDLFKINNQEEIDLQNASADQLSDWVVTRMIEVVKEDIEKILSNQHEK